LQRLSLERLLDLSVCHEVYHTAEHSFLLMMQELIQKGHSPDYVIRSFR
jgi:hypothetical protein